MQSAASFSGGQRGWHGCRWVVEETPQAVFPLSVKKNGNHNTSIAPKVDMRTPITRRFVGTLSAATDVKRAESLS